MKIILLIDPGTRPEHHRTALRQWPVILRGLRSRGLEVHVTLTRPSREFKDATIPVVEDCTELTGRGPLRISHLRALLRDRAPEVVHAHEIIPALLAGAARQRSVFTIFHRHHHQATKKGQLSARLASRLSDVTVVLSRATFERAEREGMDVRRLRLVPGGVVGPPEGSLTSPHEAARVDIPPGHPIVSCVGRFRREKGQDVLIDAIRLVAQAHLILVGDGPERRKMQAMCVGNPRVHFVGHSANPWFWYRMSDLVVLPSRSESLPLTCMEAMAAGRPVVATDVGGIRDLVTHGENGLLVRPDNHEALAQAITAVLNAPDRAQRFAAEGQRRYEESFTVDAMLDRWIALYDAELSRSK